MDLFGCMNVKGRSGTKSQSVKFFILGEEFNDDAKKVEVYKKSIDLIKHGSPRGVITPIFVTYCSRFSRMIVCYPYFDESLSDWLKRYKGGSSNLPYEIRIMIRNLLAAIEHQDINRLEDISPIVCVKSKRDNTMEVKVILLPVQSEQSSKAKWRTSFSSLLRKNMHQTWVEDKDFEAFLLMLESNEYTLENLMGHPVLQDGDSNGRLILDCFRETLTPAQHKELEEKLNVQKYDGGDWRLRLQGKTPLENMSKRSTAYPGHDFLWFARKTVAHFNENDAKFKNATVNRVPAANVIKDLYPGFISDLYKLSLEPQYLNRALG
ncbi:unnamed protein product [Triticum turgidum subsp. durum]|uniref:Uncharacterized protein n=1 Tax=Triticum turgidum subsp. durum TaxID=4567 RepID=A0A9R1R787_TRITD|nr:unnamed protein product [Triticum turgidum subsp. durum]